MSEYVSENYLPCYCFQVSCYLFILLFIPGIEHTDGEGRTVRGSARWLKISNMIGMNLFSGEKS